ncbi:MAG TPA: GNAT family N-acetyltransferase [Isosphaeraceae bacterium]
MSGYLHAGYAESLAEFGEPWPLPQCGGWILRRPIPGHADFDAMGGYPLFACRDWSGLPEDLMSLGEGLVSLALVADPFGSHDLAAMSEGFDVFVKFKDHHVLELDRPAEALFSRNRRRRAERTLRTVDVEIEPEPRRRLDEWVELYAALIRRHRIRGIRAFSPAAFARQLDVPGMVMLRARHRGATIGIDLWYVQGEVAYGHLAALDRAGYERGAACALMWQAIRHFAGRVRWIDLGAGSGVAGDPADGLNEFKRRWSNGTRTAYFCGKILDRRRYDQLARGAGGRPGDFFPAYRAGEFT